jgi:hypothetical protein
MSNTTTSTNNKSVSFRGKPEREMSSSMVPDTKNAEGQVAEVSAVAKPKKVGKKFGPDTRKKAKRAINRGMISEKAAKKHLGGY